ncbi:hypothetical protein [Streptomyces sp. NPDC020298]|uniref:WXG100 family type VII secretion target n=1 Tax=unclassified Streptomyces TaxID=2593676 RepID=UPI0034118AC1
MTHEQLAALIDEASSGGASHLAGKLSKAASTITKIGDDLMKHVKSLEWQGQAGDAFRDWGGQTASATLRLGQYAEVGSRWMETVSQAIAEAKAAMPDTSETTQAKSDLADAHATIAAARQPGAHNDPDAQKLAQTAKTDATSAQARIDAARAEAAQQVRKLAQAYEYSAQQVNSVPPPTFSPPADHMDSKEWRGGSNQYVSVGSTGSSTGRTAPSGSAGSTAQASGGLAQPGAVDRPVTPVLDNPQARHDQPVTLGIDGADTLPRTSMPVHTSSAGPHTTAPRPEVSLPGQPNTLPPYTAGGREMSPVPQARGLPSSSRLPQRPPTGLPTRSAPRMPRETGISGGRPVTSASGRSTNALPRGTVIGKEGTQGRTPMGRAMTPGQPSGPVGSGSASTAGRRLASETGGVVGSRSTQPGRSTGRPFTPGGSGLVRPGASDATQRAGTGRAGVPASPTSGARKDRQEQRPDYVTEDEETWTRNDRRVVPPVVD